MWRAAFICRSTVSDHDKTPYNEYILLKCASRKDAWADEVRGRVVGSISDLHADEARYHRDCMCRLFAKRLPTTAQEGQSQTPDSYYQPDMALKHLITILSSDKKRGWSSVELCQEYRDHGGIDLTRS